VYPVLEGFIIPLIAVGLAEFGDKTQIAVLSLSTRTSRHGHLFMGAMLAFLIADGLAIAFGSFISSMVPAIYIDLTAAALFIIFGMMMLRDQDEEDDGDLPLRSPFLSALSFVLLTEMGDKTQILAAVMATQYSLYLVLAGVMVALGILTAMALLAGRFLERHLGQETLERVAGIIFILLGVWTLVPWLI